MTALYFLLIGVMAAAAAPITLVVDRSHSMAGFAGEQRGIQLGASIKRMGTILSAQQGFEFKAMSGPRGGIYPMTSKDVEQLFGKQSNFAGSTPLVSALQKFVSEGVSKLVVLTDGMEDDGAIEKLTAYLSDLASKNWYIGVVGLIMPFEGTYYPESIIPQDFLSRIRSGLPDKEWVVQTTKCRSGVTNCYFFRGNRPLFFILLSQTGDLTAMATAIHQSLTENSIVTKGELVMAPAAIGEATMSLEAPSQTRRRVRIPSQLQNTELVCAYSDAERLPLILRIQPPAPGGLPQPSAIKVATVRILETPKTWMVATPGNPVQGPNGVTDIALQIICAKGNFFSDETTLSGRLRLDIEHALTTTTSGWWTEISATNSWQYPHKAYKLDYIVREVHNTALRQRQAHRLSVNVGMKVHN